MKTFKETIATLREHTQALLNETNIEAIATVAKEIDSLEALHEQAEEELQGAKDNLVKYVKEYAFKEKSPDLTGTVETPTLDDAIEEAFKTE